MRISLAIGHLLYSPFFCADNIKHLEQTGETETSITIEWDIDTAALKYKLTIDDFITTEFLCSTTHCTHDVTGLAPCKTYDLSLVAVCDIDEGDEIHSDAESIDGFTAYSSKLSYMSILTNELYIRFVKSSRFTCR